MCRKTKTSWSSAPTTGKSTTSTASTASADSRPTATSTNHNHPQWRDHYQQYPQRQPRQPWVELPDPTQPRQRSRHDNDVNTWSSSRGSFYYDGRGYRFYNLESESETHQPGFNYQPPPQYSHHHAFDNTYTDNSGSRHNYRYRSDPSASSTSAPSFGMSDMPSWIRSGMRKLNRFSKKNFWVAPYQGWQLGYSFYQSWASSQRESDVEKRWLALARTTLTLLVLCYHPFTAVITAVVASNYPPGAQILSSWLGSTMDWAWRMMSPSVRYTSTALVSMLLVLFGGLGIFTVFAQLLTMRFAAEMMAQNYTKEHSSIDTVDDTTSATPPLQHQH